MVDFFHNSKWLEKLNIDSKNTREQGSSVKSNNKNTKQSRFSKFWDWFSFSFWEYFSAQNFKWFGIMEKILPLKNAEVLKFWRNFKFLVEWGWIELKIYCVLVSSSERLLLKFEVISWRTEKVENLEFFMCSWGRS